MGVGGVERALFEGTDEDDGRSGVGKDEQDAHESVDDHSIGRERAVRGTEYAEVCVEFEFTLVLECPFEGGGVHETDSFSAGGDEQVEGEIPVDRMRRYLSYCKS